MSVHLVVSCLKVDCWSSELRVYICKLKKITPLLYIYLFRLVDTLYIGRSIFLSIKDWYTLVPGKKKTGIGQDMGREKRVSFSRRFE